MTADRDKAPVPAARALMSVALVSLVHIHGEAAWAVRGSDGMPD